MNRVKQLAVFFLVFVMCFGMCVPVFAAEADQTPVNVQQYELRMKTLEDDSETTYWYPAGYNNVMILGDRKTKEESSRLILLYYADGGITQIGNAQIRGTFVYNVYNNIEDIEEILFNGCPDNNNITGFSFISGGYLGSLAYYFLYVSDQYVKIYQEQTPPLTLEEYYNEWSTENHEHNYSSITTAATCTKDGSITYTCKCGETYTEIIRATGHKLNDDSICDVCGIDLSDNNISIPGIDKIIEFVDNMLHPDIDFLAEVNNKLAVKLENNGFYTSLCRIQRELSSLYNQNYNDPAEFNRINPAKITLRRPVIASEDGGSYTYSKIDWGLDNVSVIGDLKWFFGTHYNTGKVGDWINVDGSYAVKHYSDLLISAFLWIGFAFMLWQRLPDIISGEFSTITTTSADIINTSVAGNRTIDDVYRTTKVDMATGEVLSDTMTTKRKVKK